jgi:crotonobetainyl-CoA:carnitine CoA-transferase CaiB-like acyl-CoA transferase
MQFAAQGKPLVPMSAGSRAWGVYDVFETADNVKLFIGVVTDRQWQLFTAGLNEPALMGEDMATNTQRAQMREALIPLVGGIVKKHRAADLEAMCENAGLPFARVQTPAELIDDPHLNAGGMANVTLPDGKRSGVPSIPIAMGAWRASTLLDLPMPGEHDDEVLGPLRT